MVAKIPATRVRPKDRQAHQGEPMKRESVGEIIARPYAVDFEYGKTPDEGILAYLVDWPDCFAAGRTRAEALSGLEVAMRELARYRLKRGLDIPQPASTFSGRFVLRLPSRLHRDAERRARTEGVSLNTWLTQAIAREVGTGRTVRTR
jgi:predicted RNase H-like HicB family nuclease